jgi:putative transposase
VIDAEKANHSITRMTELLAVSRSGYYAWAARRDAPPGPRAVRAAVLTVKILDFHAASDQVNGLRGSWRICARTVRPCRRRR